MRAIAHGGSSVQQENSNRSALRRALAYAGHRGREAVVHANRWSQAGRRPRVVFFPMDVPRGDSSELRIFNIARVLRSWGWRCVVVPSQCELAQRQRIVRWEKPDIIYMHMSAHPANRPRFYDGRAVVFDIDGVDFLDPRPSVVEGVMECIRDSAAVVAGSQFVADWCARHNPRVRVVWTGTPQPPSRRGARSEARQPIVAWASSTPHAQPGDMALLTQVLTALAERQIKFAFRLYGADQPDKLAPMLDALGAAGVPATTYPRMAYPQFLRSMDDVAVGLAPLSSDQQYNQGKSFGKVLAYLVCGAAVVATPTADHPKFFRHAENGMLPRTPDEWIDSTAQLLTDPRLRQAVTDQAWTDFLSQLTTEAAARKVAAVLEEVMGAKRA